MARDIIVERGGATSRFSFKKVDRKKLYGQRRRLPLDPDGEVCTRGELSADGALLIRSGMTAQAYFDEDGVWWPNKDLVGIHPDGSTAEHHDSTLNVQQALHEVPPEVLLDSRIASVYALSPEEVDDALQADLEAGKLFSFKFNYRSGTRPDVGYLVANGTGMYALIGQPTEADWCELDAIPIETFDEDDGLDDDLDFEMF